MVQPAHSENQKKKKAWASWKSSYTKIRGLKSSCESRAQILVNVLTEVGAVPSTGCIYLASLIFNAGTMWHAQRGGTQWCVYYSEDAVCRMSETGAHHVPWFLTPWQHQHQVEAEKYTRALLELFWFYLGVNGLDYSISKEASGWRGAAYQFITGTTNTLGCLWNKDLFPFLRLNWLQKL